jgi:hypothetical protein
MSSFDKVTKKIVSSGTKKMERLSGYRQGKPTEAGRMYDAATVIPHMFAGFVSGLVNPSAASPKNFKNQGTSNFYPNASVKKKKK